MNGIGIEGTGHKIRRRGIVSFLVIALGVLSGTSASRAQESSGTLLAFEPFGQSGKTPFALNGASGGGDQGWASAWVEQSGSTAVPGYNIASAPALTYKGLSTTADYATGGLGYQSAGRALDVSAEGPFAAFVSNGLIHAPGQSIWISFLLRQDASGATPDVGLTAQRGDTAWSTNPANIQIGYFGTSSNDAGGIPRWSLQYGGSNVTTNVAVVKGQTVLFVVEDTFGSNGAADQINLYVNPTSLGGSPPATRTCSTRHRAAPRSRASPIMGATAAIRVRLATSASAPVTPQSRRNRLFFRFQSVSRPWRASSC